MPEVLLESADAKNNFSDLSGVDSTAFANPYDALIEASGDDPVSLLRLSRFPDFLNLNFNTYQKTHYNLLSEGNPVLPSPSRSPH
jgi:hypothetical protein